jgi:ubiquinone/menaquinone biosynthesis C-methylase UbiE
MTIFETIVLRFKKMLFRIRVAKRLESIASPASKFVDTWKSKKIPEKQWKTVSHQLDKFGKGGYIAEFDAFVEAIRIGMSKAVIKESTVLEIGCSSGYYGQVLKDVFSNLDYKGVDFSEYFVQFGKKKFKELDLAVADTRRLPFKDGEFGIVVSGSVLLHVFEWELGIQESCRVAQKLVVLHRTPVSGGQTTLFTKNAYGVSMFQWTFNECQLINEMLKNGFRHIWSRPVYIDQVISADPSSPTQFTYLFEKIQ